MRRNVCGRSRCSVGTTVGKLAVMLVVLTLAASAPGTPKDKDQDGNYYPQELTQVYQHAYDEVFQACQDAIERKGWFVTDKDKDKGTISGKAPATYFSAFVFSMHIESLNTKPETRVTINGHSAQKGRFLVGANTRNEVHQNEVGLITEVQKVLSTYH